MDAHVISENLEGIIAIGDRSCAATERAIVGSTESFDKEVGLFCGYGSTRSKMSNGSLGTSHLR